MKNVYLVLVVVMLSFNLSNAQRLEVKFYPSFHYFSKCVIYCKTDSCLTRFDIFEHRDTTKIVWSEIKLIPSEALKQLIDFFDSYEKIYRGTEIGLDGIDIEGKYTDSVKIKEFKFWSPLKNTKDHELFKMTLTTMRKYLTTKNSKRYLRKLKIYL